MCQIWCIFNTNFFLLKMLLRCKSVKISWNNTCMLALLAWSSMPLGYPDLLKKSFSSGDSYYCEFIYVGLDFPFSFILVLFFNFHWVLRVKVLLQSSVLRALSVVMIRVTSSANIMVTLFSSGSGVLLV